MIGAELGYRYAGSPLIWPEPGEAPEHNFMDYVPTTWPGARLPHVWLDDGAAMQDRIGYGHGYTLLRLGGTRADTAALERAFGDIRAPLQVLDYPRCDAARHLRLRSPAAATGPACGLARQRAAARADEIGGARHRALSRR